MDKFETLNDETTILMLNQDTFTVARLKELMKKKLYQRLSQNNNEGRYTSIANYWSPDLVLIEGEVGISIKDCQLRFPLEGLECKRLNFETKEWETGKLRILADVTMSYKSVVIKKVTLEFFPEQPTFEYKSPLDEIRNSSL